MAAAVDTSRRADAVLAAVSLTCAAVALTWALAVGRESGDDATPTVASVTASSGTSTLRPSKTLLWRPVSVGTDVHDGDAVFVAPGAETTLRFSDGTELSLDERSLVVVEPPRAGSRSVQLRQGAVSGRAGDTALVLKTAAGEARLDAKSEARVELAGTELEVSVTKGAAKLSSASGTAVQVAPGQRAAAAKAGTRTLVAWPVTLVEPAAHHRQMFHATPAPLELKWTGTIPPDARVQIARDRLFAFVEQDLEAAEDHLTIAPHPGVTWWRVVDAEGRPLSEARRFSLVEDVAPATMFPGEGEVVLAPKGAPIAFAWASLPGVSRFVVEVSPSREFEPIVRSEHVEGSTARLVLNLEEGGWYWRVRAERAGGEEGVPSEASKFRLIHKGIPDAPELLTPEVEVTP